MIAMGTLLTAKIQLHDATDKTKPPGTGPAIVATLSKKVHGPIALPCDAPVKAEIMSASELGTSSAPPKPCSNLATMRKVLPGSTAY